jgi:predicted kinase
MKTVIILRGLPGAGKTTLAETIMIGREAVHCEADQYFTQPDGTYQFNSEKLFDAHEQCRKKFHEAIERSVELVIVSNTSTMEWEMAGYLELAEQFGYRVFSLIVENRHGGKNVHDCPEEKVEIMRDRFQFSL